MKIKALKDFKWKTDDAYSYAANEIYEEINSRAIEMVKHGYAEEIVEEKSETKKLGEEKKETKAIEAEENKKPKKDKKV